MPPSKQLPLRFPEKPLGFESMTVTDANRAAVSVVQTVERWPFPVFCLIGPPKSGLTTIALAWIAEQRGLYIDGSSADERNAVRSSDLAEDAIVVDRADLVDDEAWLLGLISGAVQHDGLMLWTSETSPTSWTVRSPDLASRLKAMPMSVLDPPDETLMRVRLQRAAARSALTLPESVEDYLVIRLGLSFQAIEETIMTLAGATSGRQSLTVPLARKALDDVGPGGET